MLEYEMTNSSVSNFIKLDKDLQLEHILPKKYMQYPEWNYITDKIAGTWL